MGDQVSCEMAPQLNKAMIHMAFVTMWGVVGTCQTAVKGSTYLRGLWLLAVVFGLELEALDLLHQVLRQLHAALLQLRLALHHLAPRNPRPSHARNGGTQR
jgi:hypothetical protein